MSHDKKFQTYLIEEDIKGVHEEILIQRPHTEHDTEQEEVDNGLPYKVYKARWGILVLFVIHAMSNTFQWIQYSIITAIITYYYDVDSTIVDWTAMIYMLVYIPLIFPVSYLLERRGLRFVILIGSFGTALGSLIKCFSVAPNLFVVTFIGQFVSAASEVFILSIPPRLAAVWFGPDEVSSACAFGVFGDQLGIAFGFVLPPQIVHLSKDKNEIGHGLKIMFYGVSVVTAVLFFLIVLFFRAAPPSPPSPAAAAASEDHNEPFSACLKRLLTNRNYIFLLITYGMNVGVFYTVSTLLSQVILSHYPGQDRNAGAIGLTIVLSGMLGAVLSGMWLDKTHTFKETALTVYFFSLLGMLAYTFIFKVKNAIWSVFVIAAFLGFFVSGYLPLGFEFAAELTYPEAEGTTSGLLNASAQVFGIICTYASAALLEKVGDTWTNLFLCGVLALGIVGTTFIKADLRRQAAQQGIKPSSPKEKSSYL